ncbi:glycosyltransferase [bacterium]|nr:glycosyltransferase [bacterium]
MKMEIGIAIPAYKNPNRLRRALASIRDMDAAWLSKVTVTDDSGDGSVANALTTEFPTVTFLIHDKNLGFAEAANRAVRENKCPIVVLLNDDAELIADPRAHLAQAFESTTLFTVGLESVDESGLLREGAKRVVWRLGVARVLHNQNDQVRSNDWLKPSSYAVGGHAAYRREMFDELHGFSEVYAPFYWEDVDICARANARGLQTRFLPFPCVRHSRDGAIRATTQLEEICRITLRNRFLFSMIHAIGVQRVSQPMGFLIREWTARVARDAITLDALRESRAAFLKMSSSSRP